MTTLRVTIPIHITITVGNPVAGTPPAPAPPPPAPRPTIAAARRPAKRRTVREFLATGRWAPVLDGGEEAVESTGALDEKLLADIRTWRAEAQLESLGGPLDALREVVDQSLDDEDVKQILADMEAAVADPEAFYDAMESTTEESILSGLLKFRHLRDWYPTKDPSDEERAKVAKLVATYRLPPDVDINPREHHYEYQDPGWWHLAIEMLREKLGRWPKGLAPFLAHSDARTFVYEGKPARKVALMADFGVGQYHSRCIARALEERAYPYVFHLGDVYYGGSALEFESNYTGMLDRLMDRSTLFGLPENHELYGGGVAYQGFLRTQRDRGRIVQEGSYFCVRFPKHQFVAIDVNWFGRKRFAGDGVALQRAWLDEQLNHGKAHGLTTILLTGSAPYVYGRDGTTALFDDLLEYQRRFSMWFWGDNHYCALFPYDEDKAPFVGSCIGHAGFPGDRREADEGGLLQPDWVEAQPRFPAELLLRPDLGNNGWVELTMVPDGGVELLYVDWLGCERARAIYTVDGGRLRLREPVVDLGRRPADALSPNGVDENGDSILPEGLASISALAAAIRKRGRPTLPDEVVTTHDLAGLESLGLPGVAPGDLAQTGWAVVYGDDVPDSVRAKLKPLLDRRRDVAGPLYKELVYNRGESLRDWLSRHNVSFGSITPTRVPYHVLLVGSPKSLPFEFQYLLDLEYSVGRLWFDDEALFANYARSVVDYETAAAAPTRKQVLYFGPSRAGDTATMLSANGLVAPLVEGSAELPAIAAAWKFAGTSLVGPAATKAALLDALGAARPTVLFSASHGLQCASGAANQRARQGALVTSDWTGGIIDATKQIAAADITDDAAVHGLVAFLFACYGVGTPAVDQFTRDLQLAANPPAIAPEPFIAALPQRLLGHPRGGALAVIGHVERAWEFSIKPENVEPQIQPFRNAIGHILAGSPIGEATQDLSTRYAVLSTDLVAALAPGNPRPLTDRELVQRWLVQTDARNYLLLGDPAIKVRADDIRNSDVAGM